MKRGLDFGHCNADFVQEQKESTRQKANDTGASSSSATSVGRNNYDVFLSFSGKDTRKTFTDHLYNGLVNAGVHVFRDDDELCIGEMIGPKLLQAIENSKIVIPIISVNYASSKWCLEELDQTLKYKENGGHIVYPIFYRVIPSDVRHQTGNFGSSFSRLCQKSMNENVEKWRQALYTVASLKGWESEKNCDGSEAELVILVVRKVLSELKKASQLVVTEALVGVDKAVKEALRLLDGDHEATQLISICGMGGIGKTTLAKVLYNNLANRFEHRSYIADIRESSKGNNILHLQNQLISDILLVEVQVSNVDEGISFIESRFRSKKVLILLDDVDDKNQLKYLVGKPDCFGRGSRIIITTRLRATFDEAGVTCQYELQEIDMDQSLILFSRHAFLQDSPPDEFLRLSQDIVCTTGRLPLALEVIGSFLHNKNRAFWIETLKRLKNAPHKNVQEKLRISYDALNDEDKQIFLDIACLFIGINVRVPLYMWDACGLYPQLGIETLVLASLIKIGENQELKMHDQLRDLGRTIVHHGHPNPMYRSRLWDYEDALQVLQSNKEENNNIEALRLNKNGSRMFMDQGRLKRFPKLKFLDVRKVKFAGNFKESLYNLRWLKWQRCPSSFRANNVHLEKLLILDLSGGRVRKNWKGWSSIKMENLKVLNLSSCLDLKSTPDFSGFNKLEMLILEHCENLEEIDPSIGDVKCLVLLNLKYCRNFKKLPDQLGELKNLEELLVDGTYIQEIPLCVGSLEKLKSISAVGCCISLTIPSSLEQLVRLS